MWHACQSCGIGSARNNPRLFTLLGALFYSELAESALLLVSRDRCHWCRVTCHVSGVRSSSAIYRGRNCQAELANVVAKPSFDVSRLLQALI
jgi:hypothetical protein